MQISANFDGGNIEVVKAERADDVQLRIRKDHQSDFLQWFYFRASGVRDTDCRFRIMNGGETTYPGGFEGYRAVASYDLQHWFRAPTEFDGSVLTIAHTPERDAIYYAYFAPFSAQRHANLVARCLASPRVRLEVLGSTLDGRDIDLLQIGTPGAGKKVCWITARQHPGETMAEWWMEGFLKHLTHREYAEVNALLDKAVFYVVPNMNPDGSARGHLRTNAAGANLNREWLEPTLERSPEVYWVRKKMHETGVDFSMDVHGDEELPYNFIAGFEGIPSVTDQQLELLREYKSRLAEINPDFQTEHGYPVNRPQQGNLSMCTNYVAENFGCLSMTLEQPFKDSAITPNEDVGWSPRRCRALARSCLSVLHTMIDKL